jgi:hypothetical protein
MLRSRPKQQHAPLAPCRSARPGKFTCDSFEQAQSVARLYRIGLPELGCRPITFTIKGGTLTVEADRQGKEIAKGWGAVGRKLRRQYDIDAPQHDHNFDATIRHLETERREDAGWLISRDDGTWGRESKDNCKDRLALKLKIKREETAVVTGACVGNPWMLIVEPLQPEWLPSRKYNPNGKRLIVPSQGGKPSHPHFDMILSHVGEGLDKAVADDPWCKRHGIATGADYLLLWAASIVRNPKQPLPYLYFWSEENNTGKSSYHRALGKLFEGGDGGVDVYLCLMEKFNQAMAGCVLGFIEDKGLNAAAYERLKGWVDAPTITIRAMQTNAFTVPNYGHYIHTANSLRSLVIYPHDLRVVVSQVSPLKTDVPWSTEMSPALDKEAADFLATLLALPLPPAAGRLCLPVLETASKRTLMAVNDPRPVHEVLADAIAKVVRRVRHWSGAAGELLNTIGSGPWSDSPATFVQFLHDAVDTLHSRDIVVSVASTKTRGQRELCVGEMWLTEQQWTADEVAEDEERTVNLLLRDDDDRNNAHSPETTLPA